MVDLRATLRLQFHHAFTLDDVLPWLDYFARLGISHLYASPLLAAQPGSLHGYDAVDPTRISDELGGEAALRRLVAGLRQNGMGLIVDTVANHMRIGAANPWWQDVLEWGLDSPYAHFFDIRWQSDDPLLDQQVLLPCLGEDYIDEVTHGRIRLDYDAASGRFLLRYGEQRFPLCPSSYGMILCHTDSPALLELAPRFVELHRHPLARHLAQGLCQQVAAQLANDGVRERLLAAYRDDWRSLHRLIEQQSYRLANWRVAADDINWRRFFDINELVGLRAEHPDVFAASHACLLRLMDEGLIDGLRIDHVDGLADPRGYCRRLWRATAGAPVYVEKILAPGERLPADWKVRGTTGYDFMNQVSQLQHDAAGEPQLRHLWREFSGRHEDFAMEVRQARERVLGSLFAGDLEGLSQQLWHIARFDLASRDIPLGSIRRALHQLLAAFPVYRTYAGALERSAQDRHFFSQALEQARHSLEQNDWRTLEWLDRLLGGEPLRAVPPGALRQLRRLALDRFQQLTPPIAAKSLEDTACYRSAMALGRNDVGFDPQTLGGDAHAFHRACQDRQRDFPQALLATATHDHKRGEDNRARLAVISERSEWFAEQVWGWWKLAAPLRRQLPSGPAPSGGDELILYQCLLGSWPLDLSVDDESGLRAFHARLEQWQRKAIREAKLDSDWSAPNEAYEQVCGDFLGAILLEDRGAPLRRAIAEAAQALMPAGALNALAQCVLRNTTPGVPDLYQGCELWDFSLVDPDNRRVPDFAAHEALLDGAPDWPALLRGWRDGRIKQALLAHALGLRKRWPALFAQGDYLPLEVRGEHAARVVAFARAHAGQHLLVVVPRCGAALLGASAVPHIPAEGWRDTRLHLPASLAAIRWSGLAGPVDPHDGEPRLAELLRDTPVNILTSGGER
ncbi:malto-oligosyltrehalose synthase [Pseudomonas sp. PDNC002]|uniref:malto-oligosyltrehalose synthase n=1 Tax=Pseudomonas sp. PDNC002 TaxID=2811422 RepID=UPI001963A706|nr:malto-oligosyltrehalose synthase [Pseudomonas sp. PDNC002]QRY77865.1 malto-oligosyltrehalose synthase [Pseudomonas sp. PDNC002]